MVSSFTAPADIVTLSIALAVMLFLDVFAYRTKIGTLYLGSLMLGVYCEGTIFTQQDITYSVTQLQTNSTFYTAFTINGGLWAVLFAVMILMTFMLFYSFIEGRGG